MPDLDPIISVPFISFPVSSSEVISSVTSTFISEEKCHYKRCVNDED